MGIEIERKYTVKHLPDDLEKYPVHIIEQGYLNVIPAIRVRRQDDKYYMTYKRKKDFGIAEGFAKAPTEEGAVSGKSLQDKGQEEIGQVEYNMLLDKESYEHLVAKADGNVIRKKRYLIPLNDDAFSEDYCSNNPEIRDAMTSKDIKIELDVFDTPFDGRILAEVEFPSEEAAAAYKPADWFLEDVTGDVRYSNAHMSAEKL
ncbi:adenylate cyclase [Butyrivibrio sp. JL13D10]|uniref:adenylate cyclase n=1 Tax=Butyrivibrio sp. JL13D10 TaxID=3236815 RepID=UPI0038B43FC1